MIALLLNHLWQSSLCVAGAGLLALTLHRNGAHVRFWLWFAASVKFLVPFALLTALGTYLLTPILPPVAAPAVGLMEPLAKPFSTTAMAVTLTEPLAKSASAPVLTKPNPAPAAARLDLQSAVLAVWAAGFLIIALRWLVRWSRVRALLREAVAVQVDAPIAVKFSSSRLEPGLVGILKPVILLPCGIEQQLSAVELKAVLAHELCHWRRHDNLLAASPMLVEALFWFFPLVWWLGARLNAERERACDENVLAQGNDPQMYAEGILKVCRAYLQSPVACVAGVSGGGLKKRMDAIMENRLIPRLNVARKFVLSASAALVLVPPLLLGLSVVPVAQMQAKAAAILAPIAQTSAVEAASAVSVQNEPGRLPCQRMASALQSKNEAAPTNQSETPTPPSPGLPEALPNETLATPPVVASNGTPNDQPAAPVQAATPEGSIGAPAVRTEAATASHPKTEAGLRCLLGLEPKGCETRFENPFGLRRAITYCAGQYAGVGGSIGAYGDIYRGGECPDGPLESVEYFGTNAAGDDVYVARFQNKNFTYILPQPGPDGKIAAHTEIGGSPAGVRYPIAHVTSPAGQERILYTRPAEWSDTGTANTPSGAGDPNATVCRPPQHIAGSDQLGPQVCLHNHEWWKLAMNGKDIAPDGKTLIAKPTVDNPKGEGDPDVVTCRTPKAVSGGQRWGKRFGPEVCRPNSFWADLIKNHQIVDANGVVVTRRRNDNDWAFFGSIDRGSNNYPGGYDSGQHQQSAVPSQWNH